MSDNKLTLILPDRRGCCAEIEPQRTDQGNYQEFQVDSEKQLLGRQDEIKKITIKPETKGQSLVVNLFGLAGVGKATLAKGVCSKWHGECFVCDSKRG